MSRSPTWALYLALAGCAAEPAPPAPAPAPRPSSEGEARDPYAGRSGLLSHAEWLERRGRLSGVCVYTNDPFGPPGPQELKPMGWIHDPALCARVAASIADDHAPGLQFMTTSARYLGLEFSDGEPAIVELVGDADGRPDAVRFGDGSASATADLGQALGEGYRLPGGFRIRERGE